MAFYIQQWYRFHCSPVLLPIVLLFEKEVYKHGGCRQVKEHIMSVRM